MQDELDEQEPAPSLCIILNSRIYLHIMVKPCWVGLEPLLACTAHELGLTTD
jgi:hypothetical protein